MVGFIVCEDGCGGYFVCWVVDYYCCVGKVDGYLDYCGCDWIWVGVCYDGVVIGNYG